MPDQPTKAKLVTGGVFDGVRYDGSNPSDVPSFDTQTMPFFLPDCVVVGVTHPNIKTGHPTDDGWIISDFYAFNYLLLGKGRKQTWLTAADPRRLLALDPPHTSTYLRGNEFSQRKVVLSDSLLDQGEITLPTVVSNTQITDSFLKPVAEGSTLAKHNNTQLLILIFCHGTEGGKTMLDASSKHKGLSFTRLKYAIEPGCRVTLITTACYSGDPGCGYPFATLSRS